MASINPPAHTRGQTTTDSWITPRWLLERLGNFDLDPCACDPQPWPTATTMITEAQNGLMLPWKGFVWCNPPYGKSLGVWLERMSWHANGIALVFARTDTRAFHQHVWGRCSSILFLKGRLTFHRPDGSASPAGHNSGGPSCLIAYGPLATQRLENLTDLGALVRQF